MTDSIASGPDGQVNHTLELLRQETREGPLETDMSILPGIEIHSDPALGLNGLYRSTENRILDLEADMSGVGGWFGLHLSFPAEDLRRHGVLGFACRGAAPDMQIIRACLRSGVEGGFEDCFFDKHILLRPEDSSHVDALSVHHRDRLPPEAPWRELVLFLPTHGFRLSLHDFRVFLV